MPLVDTNPEGTSPQNLAWLQLQSQLPAKPIANTRKGVEFVRAEVEAMESTWALIDAAVEGEKAIKALGEIILPRPNPADISIENTARYRGYLCRAVWYPVSGRTLQGLTGFVFSKEPTITLPEALKNLAENVDGAGVTLAQQAKNALRRVLGHGRSGLLVDYPKVGEKPTSKQDLLDGNISPTIILCEPQNIINWRIKHVGSAHILELLVLRETYVEPNTSDDPFTICTGTQYRVLKLDENGVHGEIWRKLKDAAEFTHQADLAYDMKGQSGTPLKVIPFTFLGAVNNDEVVDMPPLLDLVNLNIAHFRNSADYEESCYMVGQPTPWVSGLSASWVTEQLKGTVHLGSRAILPLPVGASAGLLQADPNTLPMEAMKHKEEQMVSIGAKLVDKSEIVRTATEASIDQSAEVSVLGAAANNVFLAYKAALTFCGEFVGKGEAEIVFKLSEPLTKEAVTSDAATAIMTLFMAELIDYEEARTALRRNGLAFKDDDEVRENSTNGGLPLPPAPVVEPGEPKPAAPPVAK